MQNTDEVIFKFLFTKFYVSKLVILLSVAVVAFIIGILAGRPGRSKYTTGKDIETDGLKKQPNTLSDEDRDYIS
jgi:hypothetical protein